MKTEKLTGAFIETNRTKVWLDLKAMKRGDVRHEEGSETDQCDGCGSDLMENCFFEGPNRLTTSPALPRYVICGECKSHFEIVSES